MESGLFKNGLSCPQFVYAQVILPLKYKGEITYVVPEQMAALVDVGSRVKVDFAGRIYTAVVESLIREAGAVESLYNLGLEKGIVY